MELVGKLTQALSGVWLFTCIMFHYPNIYKVHGPKHSFVFVWLSYRSGNIWVVKQEVADALFAPHGAPKSGVAFVDVTIASQMQLPDVNLKA